MSSVNKLANVIIPVADQESAVGFYTETLGLQMRLNVPMGPDARWIEVAPNGSETTIAICPPGPGTTAGHKDTGISLATDDIDGYHAQLRDRGVDTDAEVSRFGDGIPPLFWFRDPEGNTLMVVEIAG